MDNQEWLNARRQGIGGSDSPIILGVSPFKNMIELWQEKLGFLPDQEESPEMKRGSVLEHVAADLYSEITGRKLRKSHKILHDKDNPIFLANIDRHIVSNNGKGPGVLEIKCPGLSVFAKCKREGLPDYYKVQLQHYLMVTGWQWGSFGIFNAERWELLYFDVARNDQLIKEIQSQGIEFWERVRSKEQPDIEVSDEDLDLPKIGGEYFKNFKEDPAWSKAVQDLQVAREILSEAEELEKSAKERIQGIMDENDITIAEGSGCRIYWKWNKGRKSFDKKTLKKDHPDIDYSKYEKEGKPFRTFKPYFLKQSQVPENPVDTIPEFTTIYDFPMERRVA